MYYRHPGLHIQRTEFSPVLIGQREEIAIPGSGGSRGDPGDRFLDRLSEAVRAGY